jgi:hypothetical protein
MLLMLRMRKKKSHFQYFYKKNVLYWSHPVNERCRKEFITWPEVKSVMEKQSKDNQVDFVTHPYNQMQSKYTTKMIVVTDSGHAILQ